MKNNINTTQNGFVTMITLLFFLSMIMVIVFSLNTVVLTTNKITKNSLASAQSYYTAESGLEDGILRVMKGYEYDAVNSFDLSSEAQVEQSVTQAGSTTTIESMAIFANNKREMQAEMTITVSDISFYYGVQVGEGGLTMANPSTIRGNLYSNGTVVGQNNSSSLIDGDVSVATGMNLDHSHSVYNADTVFGSNNPHPVSGLPVIDVAQSFKPTESEVMSQVSFYMKKVSNPSDKTIRVFTDDGTGLPQSGSPTKIEIGSATLTASKIGTNYGWVDFSFSSPPALSADQWYWIVIDTSESNSKYFSMATDSNKGDGNGVSKYTEDWDAGSPVWTEDTGDFDFKIWLGGVSTFLDNVNVSGTAHANTIKDSNIAVDAYAKNIINSDIVGDAHYELSFTGTAGSTVQETVDDPVVVALPVSDSNIADWQADALLGGTFSDAAHCSPTVDVTLNASVLDCDFNPAAGIEITINGVIWVKGNINIGNGTGIRLSSSYGANSGIILADKPGSEDTSGKIKILNNVGICGSEGIVPASNPPSCNSPSVGSYILLFSTHEHDTTFAIEVDNNASGAIFYAHKGIAKINNNANLKEVTAYKLDLAQNATVTYESGLANASFSSGPGGGWEIKNWNEIQ